MKKRSKHLPLSEKDYDWIKVATTFSWVPAKRDYQWLEPEDYLSSFLNGENVDPALSTEFQGDGSMDSMSDAPLPVADSEESGRQGSSFPPALDFISSVDISQAEEELDENRYIGQVPDSMIRLRPSIDVPAELPSLQEYKLEVISALQRRGIRIEMDKIVLSADLEEQLASYHEKRGGPIDSYDLRARLQKYKQQVIDSYDQFAALGSKGSFGMRNSGVKESENASSEEDESYESFILSSLNRLEASMREESAQNEELEGNEESVASRNLSLREIKAPSLSTRGTVDVHNSFRLSRFSEERNKLRGHADSPETVPAESDDPGAGDVWMELPVDSRKTSRMAEPPSRAFDSDHKELADDRASVTDADSEAHEESEDLSTSQHADKVELLKAFNKVGSRFSNTPAPSYIHRAIETAPPEEEAGLEDESPLTDFLLQLRHERDDAGTESTGSALAHDPLASGKSRSGAPARNEAQEIARPEKPSEVDPSIDSTAESVNGKARNEEEVPIVSKGFGRARYLEEERKKLYSLIGKLEQNTNFLETEGDRAPASDDFVEDALDVFYEKETEIEEGAATESIEPQAAATSWHEQDVVIETDFYDKIDEIFVGTERSVEDSLATESEESDLAALTEWGIEPVESAAFGETYREEKPLMDEISEEEGAGDMPVEEDPERPGSIRIAREGAIMPQSHMNRENVSVNMPEADIHPDETENDSMRSEAPEEAPGDRERTDDAEDIGIKQVDAALDERLEEESPVDDGLIETDEALAQDVPLDAVIESLAFATEDPIPIKRIARIYAETQGVRMPTEEQMSEAIQRINAHYEETGRAFRIKRWGGGIRMASHPRYAPFIRALYDEHGPKKLSRTLMETLAIVAYSQPTTKPEIDFVRGVDSDYSVRKLLEIGLIDIVGRSESIGRPLLYGTSERFLEQFGLSSLEALPKLREVEELLGDPAFKKERLHLLALEGMEEAAMAIDEGRIDDGASGESNETEAKNAEE